MSLFDDIIAGRKLREAVEEANKRTDTIENLYEENVKLKESNGMAQLKLEDYKWIPIDGWNNHQDTGFDIQTIKDESSICRQLYAVNPLIKKAVTARIGMIHGRGCRIVSDEKQDYIDKMTKQHRREIFGPVAQANLESELSVTGNVFIMRDVNLHTSMVVPLSQIVGYLTQVDNPTNVLYWKRQYNMSSTDIATGDTQTHTITEYIPSITNKKPVSKIGEVWVRTGVTMFHIAANRQQNWVLGLPDLFAAKFWAKGHKEMFEAGHEFAMAQGQIAAKTVVGNSLSGQLAASRLAATPRRDPDSGEVYNFGSTAVMTNGMDYQLVGKMGSGVDFANYDRVTGLIAAGIGVPLNVLLATADDENTSMEQSVINDMRLRQQLWADFYEDFFAPLEVQVVFPRIKQETVYRVNQSVEISNRSNTLTAEEKRLITLEAYGLETDVVATPDINDHPDVQVYRAKKEIDLEYEKKLAEVQNDTERDSDGDSSGDSDGVDNKGREVNKRSTTPDQGNDQGIGKLSDGDDAHDLRDKGEQEHTTK